MRSRLMLILACCMLYDVAFTQMTTLELHANWQFRHAGDTSWIPATVPGCVHTDLIANNVIPDPFFGDNENKVQWVENEDWEYRTTFHLHRNDLQNDFIDLEFEGLDTYADVFLNDSLILQADNMFRTWNIAVKKYLIAGDNHLLIKFYSPVKKASALRDQFPIPLPSDERVFVRKAQYQFGWDWGPRLVTSGIWKPIQLHFNDRLKVKQASFYTKPKSENGYPVHIDLAYQATGRMHYLVEVRELTTGKICYAWSYRDQLPTIEQIDFDFNATNNWMPYEVGDQTMYAFEVTVKHNRRTYFQQTFKTGFSDIKLHQEPDASGSSFYFTANNKPIYIKGANFIPAHSFPTQATIDRYRDILIEAKRMHINMIRVWGGGIYEHEALYDLCDSLGIMVWQDFMFACAMYPNDVKQYAEFSDQISRLKDHPCLALWCGNNEIDEGWNNWGWQKQLGYNDADSAYVSTLNTQLFRDAIPEYLFTGKVLQSYHPSSPTHGWGRKESLTTGDAHYWGVWWGKQPFSMYNKKVPRFMSEYGFQGMPSYRSLQQFISDSALYLGSAELKVHQKHPVGYETIDTYMRMDFDVPASLEAYTYVSQLVQADGMRTAIEAHRRNMPYCMGTMFWQLNDCWPVTSWSVQDYYGNRKAAWYAVEKCYRDVMISVLQEDDKIETWLVNDQPLDKKLEIEYVLMTTKGERIRGQKLPITLKAHTSTLYSTIDIPWFLNGVAKENCVLYLTLLENGNVITERTHFFTRPGDVTLQPATISCTINEGVITLTSNTFVRQAYVYTDDSELRLSDNFIDLLPNTPKQISLQDVNGGITPTTSQLKVLCLNQINQN